jgi:DNA-binding transcriptional LysR family regulator
MPEELKSYSCLVYSQRGNRRKWQFIKDKKEMNVYIEPHLQSNNSTLFREILLSHQGVALIPDFIVSNEITSGKLIPVLTDYSHQESLYALKPANYMIPMWLKVFIEFINNELI